MIDFSQDRIHPHLSRGFAYIEFSSPDEAETAMKHMDGGQIDGQVRFSFRWLPRKSYLKNHFPCI